MKKLILDLYRQIEKEQIKNNIHSKYWVFHTESVLLREAGVSKRYLKVLFFNRMMNEHDNLLRLYINVNGERIEKDDFVVSGEYHDKNIMGFILERDLIDEGEDVTIEAYVVDGKKQELSKDYMVGFPFCDNQQKFQAFMEFTDFLTSEMITAPYFDQEKWVCACGYTNQILDPICPICASKKEKMQELYEMKLERVVLKHCKEGIKLNVNQSYQEILHKYAKEIEQKYGINESEVLSCFDLEALRIEQEQMIDEYIKQYIQKKHVCFTPQSSFESCLDMYYKGICNDIITKDMVESKLDLKQLKEEYEANKHKQERKAKISNKHFALAITVMILLSICFIVYQIFIAENHPYEGIQITNTYEYRKSKCEDSTEYDEIANSELKKLMQVNAFCYIDYSSIQPSQISVEETENDMVRPLDENHVLIQHREFIEPSVEKTVRYIADLDGNIVYGDIEHNYTLTTYENERIIQEDIYRDNVIKGRNVYHYEDDDHYTIDRYAYLIMDGPPPMPNYTIRVENGKITEEIHGILRYRYIYVDNKLSEVIQEDISYADDILQKSHSYYKNGVLNRQDNMGWDGSFNSRTEYIYDANGFLLQELNFDNQDALQSGKNYFYDFENGIVYRYLWMNIDGLIQPLDFYKKDIDFYISHYNEFKDLIDFDSTYVQEEWISINDEYSEFISPTLE